MKEGPNPRFVATDLSGSIQRLYEKVYCGRGECENRIAAQLQSLFPDEPALLYRALLVQSARWPEWADALLTELRQLHPRNDQARRQQVLDELSQVIRCVGYGIPDANRATANSDHRVTLITSGETPIRAKECHIYQVPVPQQLRQQADEFDIAC